MASRESTRRFHFLKEIASGGFGSVYLAKVMHADGFSRLAAIKLLHQRWSENAEIAQRMRDEARLLGWLRHRNIVDVIDLTTIGGRVAVIMEYLEAIDFKGAITHVAEVGERMPPRVALEAVAFVGSALDAAYNRPPYQGEKPLRVIHRDIKPSNIMVDEAGTVKVLDFGVARADFDNRESHTQELQFGSVDYMPPERLFFEPENPFSDVYSLGATLYEILALEKLGKAKGRPEKHAQFLLDRMVLLREHADLQGLSGEAVVELVQQMLSYNHEHRPSAIEVSQRARALARGFDGEGITEWAERVLPPLVKALREAPREPNPLTDSILSEDSASFKADDTYVESAEQGGVVLRSEDAVPHEIPATDARWDLLRRAAMDEIQARDPAANFVDGPTVMAHVDDELEVIDEAGSTLQAGAEAPGVPPAFARTPLAPSRTILPPSSAMDAPSAPFVKKAQAEAHAEAAAWPDGSDATMVETLPPGARVTFQRPEPAAPARPAPPDPTRVDNVVPAAPVAAPALAPSPAPAPGLLAASLLRSSPTMIPDDDYAPTQAFVAPPPPLPEPLPDSPDAFGDASTVVGQPGGPRDNPDDTAESLHAGSLPPPPASSDPPIRPVVAAGPAPAQPAPARSPTPRPAPVADVDADEEPPKPRSWLIPGVVIFLFAGALILGGTLMLGGALLSGTSPVTSAPTPAAAPPPAQSPAAATMAASTPDATPAPPAAAAGGGMTFVSAAPDTAKITVSCDGVEVSGPTSVGLGAASAQKCSVKVMLEDRTRLFSEVTPAEAGTYRCFEGGSKDCVR